MRLLLWLAIALVLSPVFIWPVVRQIRIIRAQLEAYRRGDYEGQLKVIERFRVRGSEPKQYLFFRGAALYQLGRLDEAERALRRSLAMETNRHLKTYCRDELARVLMAQERWDNAASCFRECIGEFPKRGGGHRSMAELLLRRGEQREAALDAARRAEAEDRIEKAGLGKLARESKDLNLGESLAVLAWARARNGGSASEVDRALKEAFALCGDRTKPVLAEIHFMAGHAYEELGNTAESRRHFQHAAEVDPIGNYGRFAASALAAVAK